MSGRTPPGADGPTGPDRADGADGVAGADGPTGPDSADGVAGTGGADSTDGPDGVAGPDGPRIGPGAHPDVILCPGGPMLLRGDHVVVDEDGAEHATHRPVSAVCRCGASAIRPWCDGTHKMVRSRRPAR